MDKFNDLKIKYHIKYFFICVKFANKTRVMRDGGNNL